jgi:hypothetical protein
VDLVAVGTVLLAIQLLAQMEQQTLVEALVVALLVLVSEEQAVLASSSSRLTNKDIHAKQSLSILWN